MLGNLALILTVFAVFWQVHTFDFINYDDDKYVNKNSHISTGFTREGIVWIFTHSHVGNWHPLTGLSHTLDCELFGLNAGRHHSVNLLFHIANTLLLFTSIKRITRALWQSAFVAALFAIHPLHVESVAWISERKDVLSTFFWLLTIITYCRYVKNPKTSRYILTLVFFALGLMAKPMLVTVPFVLLLLDYWPFERLERKNWQHLILEKIPFFVLSAISSIVTFLVQRSTGTVTDIQHFPLNDRLANGLISYIRYIQKMFWPGRLAIVYPVTGEPISLFLAIGAALLLLIISVLVIRLSVKYKYLFMGWFWYLGTLVPVIGLVQVGTQTHADRYTYIPLIGLFIIVAWGFNDLLVRHPLRKVLLVFASSAVILVLSMCTAFQIRYWENSLTLFEHTLAVTHKNHIAHTSIGLALMDQNRLGEAINHFRKALEIQPGYPEVYNSLGSAFSKLNYQQEAVEAYKQAISIKPDYTEAYNNLGVAYTQLNRFEEAIESYKQAIKIKPDYAEAYNNLGTVYNQLANYQEAVESYRQAIRLRPDYANAHYNLGLAYLSVDDKDSALEEYKILKTLDVEKAKVLFYSFHK